jgi:hypothetical protein
MVTVVLFASSCAYIPIKTEDEPPPLPPIAETKKPPLEVKPIHFREFPWDELEKPTGDQTPNNTYIYTVKEGDTLESIAREQMGDASLSVGLATYNGLSSNMRVSEGENLIIPYPIVGIKSEVLVKPKDDDELIPDTFEREFNDKDEFRMRFEPNVDGHCYIFRVTSRSTSMLYPYKEEKPRRPRPGQEPGLKRKSSEVKAHEPIGIPEDEDIRIKYNHPTMAGDRIVVFLSISPIPALEELKEEKIIQEQDLIDVMHSRVKPDKIITEPPIRIMRVPSPLGILGFALSILGD